MDIWNALDLITTGIGRSCGDALALKIKLRASLARAEDTGRETSPVENSSQPSEQQRCSPPESIKDAMPANAKRPENPDADPR